jgi:enamine deaminase RidA (YjgF/YER057c/UK114 family)
MPEYLARCLPLPRPNAPVKKGEPQDPTTAIAAEKDNSMNDKVEARLATLGIVLPEAPNPVANYMPSCLSGNLLFISGQISKAGDGTIAMGRLGGGMTVAEGRAAARLCALNILSQARAALGGLDRIAQIARLTGFVSATPEFTEHPQVMNGASDLMVEVLGDKGRHTRVAVGVSSLPLGCAVEVDAVIVIQG